MLNQHSPATAVCVDNGVDEPLQFLGLSKLEYTAIHLYEMSGESTTACVLAAHDLLHDTAMTIDELQDRRALELLREKEQLGKPPDKEPSHERRNFDND